MGDRSPRVAVASALAAIQATRTDERQRLGIADLYNYHLWGFELDAIEEALQEKLERLKNEKCTPNQN